jgi:two-component system response regulator ArlR
MRVLLIEDEKALARMIEVELLLQGMSVDICYDGHSGLAKALGEEYDILLLDWMLPDTEGILVCRALRGRGSRMPIIIITARQGVSSEVRGLDEGADDYIEKPFDMELLVARIKAVTRRSAQAPGPGARISFGSVSVDPDTRAVYEDGNRIHLTNKEYEIFVLLLENRGKVVTKDGIRSSVWGSDFHLDEGAIAVHIKGIRNKLKGIEIENVRSVGYIIPREDRTA